MYITFLIGNGFDLNLGAKTGYRDYLKTYIKEGHKNSLSDAINSDIDTWADLERQLGIYAGSISEKEVDDFFQNKDELENSLVQYLKKVSEYKIKIGSDGANEFKERITGFTQFLPIREQDHYKNVVSQIKNTIYYQFIDFNYTEYLDQIYIEAKKIVPFGSHVYNSTNYTDEIRMPLHIHGYLDDEMVLGVNDATQIGDGIHTPLPIIIEYLTKPLINDKLGNQKRSRAKAIIDKSIYICVYGMSLGITDKEWWSYLGDWLMQSVDHRLILFMYDDPSFFFLASRTARKQDDVRRRFLAMIGRENEFDKLSKQIVVQFNSPIFNFENIKLEA